MTSSTLRRRTLVAGLAGLLGLGATACSGDPAGGDRAEGQVDAAAGSFPVTVANCAEEVTLSAPPERVVLLDSAPVTILDGIGVLDRVVARAGSFPDGYFTDDLRTRLAQIPALSEDIDTTGHLQINQEVVIAQSPDLVLGLPDGITREGLRTAGAEALLPRTYCGDLGDRASFEALHAEIVSYGEAFGRTDDASSLVTSLEQRIGAVAAAPSGLSAAVLYASSGGGPLYAYGATSMATAQLDALGVENAFAGAAERVFEIGPEPLLAADPDLLIVLHEGKLTDDEVIAESLGSDRLAALRAVQDSAVLPLLFNFSEPASPLVVDGLERIGSWIQARWGAE